MTNNTTESYRKNANRGQTERSFKLPRRNYWTHAMFFSGLNPLKIRTLVDERLTQIVNSQYKPVPDGLVGNDDLGQMSAWLLFTYLGFYPVAPASNEYVIGRPFVREATIHLPNHKVFRVIAENMSDGNRYVGRVSLNGKSLDRNFIRHEEIMNAGELQFVMTNVPNRAWGIDESARPFSISAASH